MCNFLLESTICNPRYSQVKDEAGMNCSKGQEMADQDDVPTDLAQVMSLDPFLAHPRFFTFHPCVVRVARYGFRWWVYCIISSGRAGDPHGDCDIRFIGAHKGILTAKAQQ